MKLNILLICFIVFFIAGSTAYPQVNVEKSRLLSKEDGISIDLSLAGTYVKGNTEIVTIDASSGAYYKKGKIKLFLKGLLGFGEKNNVKYLNKGFLHLRGMRKLSDHFQIETFLQAEFNEFILLKSRKLGGGGLRLKIAENKDLIMFAGAGLMYEIEKFSERDGEILKKDTNYFKTTNYLSLNWMITKSVSLGVVSYFQARISHFSDYRILSDMALQFKISNRLSFLWTANHRYDHSPPLTIKKSDLTIKTGIGLSI